MNLQFDAEVESFRSEVRDFVRDNLPGDIRARVAAERMEMPRDAQQRWHKALHSKGWAVHEWPAAYGGQDWSDAKSYVFEREIALADAPRPMTFGVGMLGPTLIEFGTDDQKERFLPSIANGDHLWCQGFSEPNAGSDLASLQCKAVLDGDIYVINGSKTWTTDGHVSDWMFGLFRTDSSGKKQHGITVLLIPMDAPGVTMTPILTFEGTHEVNQVFFDNVRVPVIDRLGDHDTGWGIAKYMLGLERFGTAEVSRSMASMKRLKNLATTTEVGGRALIHDPVFMTKIARTDMELRALELTEQRFLFQPGGADAMGAEASMLKIRGTEIQNQIYELMVDALGYDAHMVVDEDAVNGAPGDAGHATRAYFNMRKTAIYSGSNEIQKGIIAKMVLDL
ncbi:MAG: pimeloyl-CoA dehydrogenase large subunit [Rhodospirillales bacterium]|nr:pimeloyl-CoA dehydrogenase large subunit [Rhodospirillales bacterium]MBT4041746.1 pimeloyl-CoA dehydrogenase large subunit [Rhodospirillales bacterium]MBT4627927.1 pimeloyl-CoA dehydrogenase large subunit [Rhodospirillales bacterium]MBT5350658.1 pimeloyl-CoA dehydrogenase large subunit [Rhodospirillales bacterium]MBT5520581.1 pimeloyl-CoA dehydrogenase large subunit [Rhodospirillales bacterium]